ncbi:MAG: hypothetical protein AAGF11_01575 [Myxococcota bacterium]
MCLIVVDGTWSFNFNNKNKGKDYVGRPIGKKSEDIRSNARRFYEESAYPDTKKFYFVGPGYGMSGNDSPRIYRNVVKCIDEQIKKKNCDELAFVGWSRGAAIISEVAEGLAARKEGAVPPIKFVGLFDSVAMIWRSSPVDRRWGEDITSNVQYFAHVVAGDRTGPVWGVDFRAADPLIKAGRQEVFHLANATHGGVGGDDSTAHAQTSYDYIRNHATIAGVL